MIDVEPDLLAQPSIRDARGLAIDAAQERLQRLDLTRLLVYAVREVTPTALPHLIEQFHMGGLEGSELVSGEAEQRRLIIDAIAWHRLKGTLSGLRWAGRRAGLQIVRAITPPARVYCAPALTREERDAFLARYPQLRLYRYRTRGQRLPNGWHSNAAYPGGTHYPVASDAVLRLGWRSFLARPDGTETPMTTLVRELARPEAMAVLDLAIRAPGAAGRGVYPARPPIARQYLVSQSGAGRLFNVRLDQPYSDLDEQVHLHAVRPGLDPVDIRYRLTAERWVRHGIHVGAHLAGCLCDNGAADRLYRQLHLFDPAVAIPRRGKSTHLGALKLGMPPYTAELRTSQPLRLSPRVTSRFCDGYLAPRGVSRLERGRLALREAAALRDRIWIDTHDRQTVSSGGAAVAGRYVAGQIISRSGS